MNENVMENVVNASIKKEELFSAISDELKGISASCSRIANLFDKLATLTDENINEVIVDSKMVEENTVKKENFDISNEKSVLPGILPVNDTVAPMMPLVDEVAVDVGLNANEEINKETVVENTVGLGQSNFITDVHPAPEALRNMRPTVIPVEQIRKQAEVAKVL